MSRKTALRAAVLVFLLVLCVAAALAGSEAPAPGDGRLESFRPTERVRADDTVPFPVNI